MILALETSCDDTCAAVVDLDLVVRSSIRSSQSELHARFGGVVPEVASRRHLELVGPVIETALADAAVSLDDITLVAATQGPGLIGALLVGLAAGKAIAWARSLPFAPVDHLAGHVAALYLAPGRIEPPFLCLLASGGHTLFLDVPSRGELVPLGGTLDDAAGEAFDKGARLLGLAYPGGPALEQLARDGDPVARAVSARPCRPARMRPVVLGPEVGARPARDRAGGVGRRAPCRSRGRLPGSDHRDPRRARRASARRVRA